jgi:hypothetical protein
MTLEEFEEWFDRHQQLFFGIITGLYAWEDKLFVHASVEQTLKQVSLQEDRDFLMLKYSEYL